MNPFRKSIAVAAISAAAFAGMFGVDAAFVRDARAEDGPSQGKVQAPVQVSPQEQQQLEGLASIFRKVGHSIEPSVVNIRVTKSGKAARPPGFDDMLRRFFPDQDGDGQPDVPDRFNDEDLYQEGTGSGVVMEVNGSDAYILTNNHVAGGASKIEVTLADGRRVEGGKVLGTDAKSDLAVVKIKADGLVAAPWGDSDKLEKGDWIMAFGSPFGYVGSMTHGIVSAVNRRAGILGPNGYENFIQVDAPINPGNSGGPLVNTRGEVVGINTAIASRTGAFSGIGFAIPSNQAKYVYTALKTNGKVVRGYLGVSIQDADAEPELTKTFGYDKREGVLVRQAGKNSPAAGKLKEGDIITAIAGKPVKDSQELRNTIAATPPGTELKITVFRSGKTEEVPLKIAEQPEDLVLAMSGARPGEAAAKTDESTGDVLGMKLTTPDEKLAEQYNLGETRQGALVTDVEPKSAAAKAGMQKGDVITRVFDQDVLTAKQAAEAIKKLGNGKPIRLYVANSEGSRFVVVKPTASE
jgi:serine protease Do